MKKFVAKFLPILLICAVILNVVTVTATEAELAVYAEDISDSADISYDGNTIKISSEKEFCGVYIEWSELPGSWSLYDGESEIPYGEKGFLHEYAELKTGGKYAEIRRSKDVSAKNIYVFTEGTLPEWVQVWDEPCEKADLMLCSTHADDEQLFFLGVLPYYAGELGLSVQVVYFVNHNDSDSRPHELLNGLWTVGVRNYPVIGDAPDAWSESLEEGLTNFADSGFSEDELVDFQVEMIRRFKPLIVVGHDINGEYSHGQHMVNTHTLRKALEISNNPDEYSDSADEYGVWDVPKTYLHLYEENQINIDWDIPLEKFGGKTAYEVSLEGFKCHESQHWTWFSKWIGLKSDWGVTKAADIEDYSPCKYGLYRSTVGEDVEKKNFLENITLYKDQEIAQPEESVMPSGTPENLQPENAPDGSDVPNDGESDNLLYEADKKSDIMLIVLCVAVLATACCMIVILIKRIKNSD
ncbi:MAG: PIG-L family deacetylase [Clostridia bacterium]|nr:PIG-L family deacetylase [Clostridia bacterium]